MATGRRLSVAVVGCGNISNIYLTNLKQLFGGIVKLTACADLDMKRARAKAKEHGIKAMTVKQVLASKSIDIVVNLTIPSAHHSVSLAALKSGKHIYNEKPLCITREEAQELLATAAKKNLRISCAPDTFLGAGLQTCRKIIDDGWIGTPVSATAFLQSHGPEGWHPNPDFFYKQGGGPMFDMGPYYLTALVTLLGRVERVTGSARISQPERLITADNGRYGEKIPVEIPTHISGVIDFADGCVATLITSFDVWCHNLPKIEIHGTDGSLSVPDPNTFGGPVMLRRPGMDSWQEMPLSHSYAENSRGIGVADMATGIVYDREHRANGELASHVLDLMHSFHDASDKGRHIKLKGNYRRPAALPLNLLPGTIDN